MEREGTTDVGHTDGVPHPPRLSITGLSKRYGQVCALDDVTLDVAPGEVMALLGQNGAGKSTLVKVLSGLVQPDAGELRIDGEALAFTTGKRSQAAGIAVVQQEISAVRSMTVAENLFLGRIGAPFIWTRRKMAAQARELLGPVGLEHLDPATPIGELGVGAMQLVEVARVLAGDARIIVFDEPTAALSDVEIERVLALVRRLRDEGRSVIYVTHRLGEVFRVTDRVTILRGGRSLGSQPTAGLDVEDVVTSMLGRPQEAMFPDSGRPGERVLVADGLIGPGLTAPVSLEVRAGEILGLTGQLGSGADAAVAALAGMSADARGDVTVEGRTLPLGSRSAGLRTGVAYCSSDRKRDGTFANLSVLKNLSSPWLSQVAAFGVLRPRQERVTAEKAAQAFAVDPSRMLTSVERLSGGNQQKVSLGKWLGAAPKVLLVIEPTRGVDVGARAEIYARLRELCDNGMAVIVSTSDTEEIFGLCDTIGAFYGGRLVEVRPRRDWQEAELLRAMMHDREAEQVAA